MKKLYYSLCLALIILRLVLISSANADIEFWDGQWRDQGNQAGILPPYLRHEDRGDHMCIAKWVYPTDFLFTKICAEETQESNFFTPAVRLRLQRCVGWCWVTTTTLKGHGACEQFFSPGTSALAVRMCARAAQPEYTDKSGKFHKSDPGYTKDVHLNYEGAEKDDDLVKTYDGQYKKIHRPKLCVYDDPGLTTMNLLDLFDYDISYQPFHDSTAEIHPIIEVLIWVIDSLKNIGEAGAGLVDIIGSAIQGDDEVQDEHGQVDLNGSIGAGLSKIAEVVIWVIDFFADIITWALKKIGSLNKIVSSDKYGCVQMPLGPLPPPYCPVISFYKIPVVTKICATQYNKQGSYCQAGEKGKDQEQASQDGSTERSVFNNECVYSNKVHNNYLNNAVRVGYDQFIPFCKKTQNPDKTDKCVVLENLGYNMMSASLLHKATDKSDILPSCAKARKSQACVRGMALKECDKKSRKCEVRLVYGKKIGGAVARSLSYRDDLKDCDSKGVCQALWGVNIGEYRDVSLPLQSLYLTPISLPLNNSFKLSYKLKDGSIISDSFNVSISSSSQDVTDASGDTRYGSGNICTYVTYPGEAPELVGCIKRPQRPNLSVYECDGIICSSTYWQPQMKIGYKAINKIPTPVQDKDAKEKIDRKEEASSFASLAVDTTMDDKSILNRANIQGYKFSAFATDDSFQQIPFSGEKAYDNATLFGDYRDDVVPRVKFENEWIENPAAVYLGGLEYIDNQYHRGGKYVCAKEVGDPTCESDPNSCVLTKLIGADIVDCKDFKEKKSLYGDLPQCSTLYWLDCVDGLPKNAAAIATKDGKTINIKQCKHDDGKDYYCYKSKKQLCEASTLPEDRMVPLANFGKTIPNDHFFEMQEKDPRSTERSALMRPKEIDESQYSIRTKTPMERGGCALIPQGYCEEVAIDDMDNGYAKWPKTKVGDDAIGQCLSGSAKAELKRRCVPNNKGGFEFEPLYNIALDLKVKIDADNMTLDQVNALIVQQTPLIRAHAEKCLPFLAFDLISQLSEDIIISVNKRNLIDFILQDIEKFRATVNNEALKEECFKRTYTEVTCGEVPKPETDQNEDELDEDNEDEDEEEW